MYINFLYLFIISALKRIVDDNHIPEREALVRASYADVFEPALELHMKGMHS